MVAIIRSISSLTRLPLCGRSATTTFRSGRVPAEAKGVTMGVKTFGLSCIQLSPKWGCC